jgi:Sensors of blue-light using FAD
LRLKTLTYTSRARLDLDEEELSDIHQSARHLNALDGITGLLLFDGTRFLQIVEGSEGAVDNLVERLRMDPRHSAFELRDERFVDRRSFSDWSMELLRVSAGYCEARGEVEDILPDGMTEPVRELVLRMTGQMAVA